MISIAKEIAEKIKSSVKRIILYGSVARKERQRRFKLDILI